VGNGRLQVGRQETDDRVSLLDGRVETFPIADVQGDGFTSRVAADSLSRQIGVAVGHGDDPIGLARLPQ
jgi:hypothetical protein